MAYSNLVFIVLKEDKFVELIEKIKTDNDKNAYALLKRADLIATDQKVVQISFDDIQWDNTLERFHGRLKELKEYNLIRVGERSYVEKAEPDIEFIIKEPDLLCYADLLPNSPTVTYEIFPYLCPLPKKIENSSRLLLKENPEYEEELDS